jgi:hypothetical protein
MPRSASGVFSKPAGTTAVSGTTIESADFNSVIDDLVTDANTARPVSAGGTGTTTAAGARTALGIANATGAATITGNWTCLGAIDMTAAPVSLRPGEIQNDEISAETISNGKFADAGLRSFAEGTATAANKIPYSTAVDTWGELGFLDEDDLVSDSATGIPSQQSVKAYVDAAALLPIGVNQSWQDVSGSRTGSSTSYQNATARPIMVCIQMSNTGSHEVQVSSDNTTWITLGDGDGDAGLPLSFIVPSNHYYRYTGGAYERWTELR